MTDYELNRTAKRTAHDKKTEYARKLGKPGRKGGGEPDPITQLTEVIVLLDRSGSMMSIRDDMVGGFNTFIEEQKKLDGACHFTLTQFDSDAIEAVYEARPVDIVPKLVLEPRGLTPLLDAMGRTLTAAKERIEHGRIKPDKVLVMIITDGQENASHEFSKDAVRTLVAERVAAGWSFTYLGADVDAFAEAGALGIPTQGISGYKKSAAGTKAVFDVASANLASFRSTSPTQGYGISNQQRGLMQDAPDDDAANRGSQPL